MPSLRRLTRPAKRLARALQQPFRRDIKRYQEHLRYVYDTCDLPLAMTPQRLGPRRIVQSLESQSPYQHVELRESIPDFQHYGHDLILKRFAALPFTHDSTITAEHGLFFGHDRDYAQRLYRGLPLVITMSDERVVFLRSLGFPAIAIGPYIRYASIPMADGRVQSLKNRLGKTLVFFPFHSAETHEIEREQAKCVEALSTAVCSLKIDTLIICYYWRDFIEGSLPREYAQLKHVTACCGHRSNPFFLDHLKLILALSDISCSNRLATVSGYSAYLGKPHFLLDCTSCTSAGHHVHHLIPEFAELTQKLTLPEPADCVTDAFHSSEPLLRKLWGFARVRTPQEIRRLLCAAATAARSAEPTSPHALEEERHLID